MGILLKNVTKIIDNNYILEDISLEFNEGKIYGLIGRNGSGKSMLLKTICGFLPPTKGQVIVNGVEIYERGQFPLSISALLDKPSYLPDLNAYENLKIISSVNNTVSDNQIKKILNLVNLENNKKVFKKFSLGMKQKLGIAQVLIEDTNIMIFDEPFNGIEEETTLQIRKFLKLETKKKKIIIIASHIKEDIEGLCDIVYELNLGKLKK